MEDFLIFSGKSHPELAKSVCQELETKLSQTKIQDYSTGCSETFFEEDVKGKTVFLFQTSLPESAVLHKDIWDLLQMVNAARTCGAKKIIAVMPYVSYARSDKTDYPGMGIGGELLAKLLEKSGINGFIGVDFHSEMMEKFFSVDVFHLSAIDLMAEALKERDLKNALILPPDMGAFNEAAVLAKRLGVPVGQVDKERISDSEVKAKVMEGDLDGKDVIIFDDEIATGGTMKALAKEIESRVNSLTFAVTHGLFSGNAVNSFKEIKKLKEIIVTDTIPIKEEAKKALPLRILSVDRLLADRIRDICKG